jgi:hypothetical protein
MRVVFSGETLRAEGAVAAVTRALEDAGDALADAPGGRVPALHIEVAHAPGGAETVAETMGNALRDGVGRRLKGG